MRLSPRNLLVAALVAASATVLSASKPVFWQTATLNDFLRGEVENLSIDSHGRLRGFYEIQNPDPDTAALHLERLRADIRRLLAEVKK